jgi:hypothetical protein
LELLHRPREPDWLPFTCLYHFFFNFFSLTFLCFLYYLSTDQCAFSSKKKEVHKIAATVHPPTYSKYLIRAPISKH